MIGGLSPETPRNRQLVQRRRLPSVAFQLFNHILVPFQVLQDAPDQRVFYSVVCDLYFKSVVEQFGQTSNV